MTWVVTLCDPPTFSVYPPADLHPPATCRGLGKTLEALMLTISNPAPRGWAVKDLEDVPLEDEEPVPIKCTLVVSWWLP